MSSNPLTPSFRTVHRIPQEAAHDSVRKAIRDNDQSITDINQAIKSLKGQVDANTKAITTNVTENVISETVAGFSTIGAVNNQLGVNAYTTQQSDNGAKILAGDSTLVSISLDPTVTIPWFTVIGNDSTSGVILSPISPASLYGVESIYPEGYVVVYFDGTNFWSEGVQIAADSTLGVVRPDDVTIDVDSTGIIYTIVTVDSGTPGYIPATPGNPFYFDSTVSPWQGYVWKSPNWNKFGGAGASGPSVLGINSQTTNYTVHASDLGKIIQVSSSSNITITLPTTFSTGFYFWIKTVGTGSTTATPSSGNIDNHASWVLSQWQATQFYWDGSLWRVLSESLAV